MYVTIWSYRVPAENREDFIAAYRADGTWAALFGRAGGYLGTGLFQSPDDPELFLTIDRWASAAAFDAFKREFGEAYADLDRACDGLTAHEAWIGELGRT
ncbi:antibiotic biosynthesis monooxygenase [Marinicauda algicola]|uniref:Antibiotic biosynthesis monooxygenase n=1 Tax=Marinicauda algicola TaxID=2029849 RepID=A0A4S2GXJ1_9PROT|nr:antibiotic biosynthesis monooxygenase family protein [Marinicauda algicola]TGY87900.1 antibiotic biosynthesis monooxygenase [Marinicauda algicola]